MTQVKLRTSTTQERPADQLQRLHVAGAGRGNNRYPPVCIAYPQPEPRNRRLLIIAGSFCSTCGQNTVCSTCHKCHYCEDVDLPCAYLYRIDRRWQEARRIRTKIDQLLETLNMPGFCAVRPIRQSSNMAAQVSGSEGGAAC